MSTTMNDQNNSSDAAVMQRGAETADFRGQLIRNRSLSLGLRMFMFMLKGIRIGQLVVNLPNGESRTFTGSERPELRGVLNVRDGALMSYVLRNGEVGFGEAYLDGLWDSPDLSPLLEKKKTE